MIFLLVIFNTGWDPEILNFCWARFDLASLGDLLCAFPNQNKRNKMFRIFGSHPVLIFLADL